MMVELSRILATGHPLELLLWASALSCTLEPRFGSPFEPGDEPTAQPALAELVAMLMDVDRPEATALLAGIATLAPDGAMSARIRRGIAGRNHHLPAWVASLRSASAGRTVQMTHALGRGETIMVEAHLPLIRCRGPHPVDAHLR